MKRFLQRICCLAVLLLATPLAWGQLPPSPLSAEPKPLAEPTFERPYCPVAMLDQPPEMPGGGGLRGITKAIRERVFYPRCAFARRDKGKVVVSFVVQRDGLISDPKIIKSLSTRQDNAALKALRQLPPLIPGSRNGIPVATTLTMPVSFR